MLKTKINKFFERFGNMTITKKITILYSGIFTISLLVISSFLVGNAAYISQKSIKSQMNDTINNISEYIKSGNVLTNENISELLADKYIEVQVINYTSNTTVKSSFGNMPPFIEKGLPFEMKGKAPAKNDDSQHVNDLPDTERTENDKKNFLDEMEKNIMDEKVREFSVSENGSEFILCEKVIKYNDEIYMIQAYKFLNENTEYITMLMRSIILFDIIGILVAVLIAKYISKAMMKPVRNITYIAERISIEDLSQRIEVPKPDDEIKELTITFNSMIDRLEKSFIQQKTFISDASHELRTPISVIQGYAKLISRWGKKDPVILEESIDSIIAETEHMSTLIKRLLYLAKGEQNKNNLHKELISLNKIVADTIKDLEIMECKRKIIFEDKNEVEIIGDYNLIKQLLWIHCENAIKYTAENGYIKISVYSENGFGCVAVEDNGAGMDNSDIPFIFDRFYRADKARNKEIPGSGLGLSIAKWIMDSHNGVIQVISEKGKGTIFINKFPLDKNVKEKS